MHVLQLSIIPGVELLSYWVCVCVALLLPASQMVVPVGFYQCRKKLRIVLYLSSHPPPCFYQRKQRGVVACSKSERSDHLNLHLITFPVASKTLPFDRCAGKGCSLLITLKLSLNPFLRIYNFSHGAWMELQMLKHHSGHVLLIFWG